MKKSSRADSDMYCTRFWHTCFAPAIHGIAASTHPAPEYYIL